MGLLEMNPRPQPRQTGRAGEAMTRQKLEALVWRHKHRDFKGKNERGERTVMRYFPEHGSCLVRLSDLTLGELLDELPRAVRSELGFQLWRLVLGDDAFALGVFGAELAGEQTECAARVRRQTGVFVRALVWAGPKPRVGDRVDFLVQSLVSA